jgi:hypothetical protein
LTLKADDADDNMGMPKTLYSHVHQLHNLESGADYELTIESRNKFGWSRPLQIDFSTLQTGKGVACLLCRPLTPQKNYYKRKKNIKNYS